MSSTRPYDNRLRAEQAQATADRIVAALCELLVEERPTSVSIPSVAKRAGVSVRTVYSHFPTKDDLFLAIPAHVEHQMRGLGPTEDCGDLSLHAMVRGAALALAHMAPLFEALNRAGIDDEDKARRRMQGHVGWFEDLLAQHAPEVRGKRRTEVATLLSAVVSHPVLTRLQRAGTDVHASAEMVASAVDALVDAARHEQATKTRRT